MKEAFSLNGKTHQQFRECIIDGVKMTTSSPENVFGLRSGDIIFITNILLTISEKGEKRVMLVAKKYIDASPCNFSYSSSLDDAVFGMKSVSKLGEENVWPMVDVTQRYCVLPFQEHHIALIIWGLQN